MTTQLRSSLLKSSLFTAGAFLALLLAAVPALSGAEARTQIIDSQTHHLGSKVMKNWAQPDPQGNRLETVFEASANPREMVLQIEQRHVTDRWAVEINGRQIAELKRRAENAQFYPIPPETLTDGTNIIAITSKNPRNDILVGPIHLRDQTLRECLNLRPITVFVSDARTGKPIPGRVTITNSKDERVEIFYGEAGDTAVRMGVIYTRGTATHLELPEGDYVFHATRGMEWGRDSKAVSVTGNDPARVQLSIQPEVDTTGFIAADTHIHTLTFSGHGDSNVEERMLTLAGEGVELAIATDHNHNTDYRPYQSRMALNEFFTAVTGNEVTTSIGHMNAFPLDPSDSVPDHKLESWVKLVDGIRARGAKVVILNHPRWPAIPTSPMTRFGLNRASGEFATSVEFPFDAMELANALTLQPDPLYLFQDWFALLNHGERVAAVGSSDSHTVDDAVGQGRTYVPSATDDPAKIDVDDACQRFVAGETSVALGIFTDIRVDERFKMGQTNSLKKGSVDVRLRVAAASWVTPRRAIVFLNGQSVAEKPVPITPNRPTDVWIDFSIKAPAHDAYLVCVVLGDGASHPSWRTKETYTLAATNPIFLDADGDGRYASPRETARVLLARAGSSVENRWAAAMKADDVISVQMISLMRQNAEGAALSQLDGQIREAALSRPLLEEYARYALPVKVESGQLR
jgi:hypothetical protein